MVNLRLGFLSELDIYSIYISNVSPLSLIFNIAGTLLYIYPIAVLNGIPNSSVPRSSIEILTSRIYPAISVTILLLIVIFADFFSYDRSAERAAKRNEKLKERSRSLTDDEKIV